MKISKIKAFNPYDLMSSGLYDWCGKAAKSARTADVIAHFVAKDPAATEWSSMGLIEPLEEGSFVHDLDGAARLLMYQFNERNLPGAVRDEKVSARFREFSDKEGRAPNKKEYAQLREDVEYELLPKAFIRRALVPVLVYEDKVFVCTTSATRAEKIMVHLNRLAEVRKVSMEFRLDFNAASLEGMLRETAKTGVIYDIDGKESDDTITTGNSIVLRGADKRTIRVKDRSVLSDDVQALMKDDGYQVTELGLQFCNEDEPLASFTLTSLLLFKSLKLADTFATGADAHDAHATYWLYAKTLDRIYTFVMDALNQGGGPDEADEL